MSNKNLILSNSAIHYNLRVNTIIISNWFSKMFIKRKINFALINYQTKVNDNSCDNNIIKQLLGIFLNI